MSAKKKNFRQHSPLSSPTRPPVARDRNKTLGKTRRYLPEKNKPSRQKLSTITPQKKSATGRKPPLPRRDRRGSRSQPHTTDNQPTSTHKQKKPTTANQKATSASPASRLRLTSVSLASHLRLTSVSFAPTILGATPYKSRRRLLPKYRLTHPAPTHPCEGRLLHPKQRPDPHPKT